MEIYFGVNKTKKLYLDAEKKQWIEFKKLNEGERIKYQDAVTGEVSMNQETKEIKMEANSGKERSELIKLAVCGYNLQISKTEILSEFNKNKWEEIYETMDGDKAQELYEEIQEFNGFSSKKK